MQLLRRLRRFAAGILSLCLRCSSYVLLAVDLLQQMNLARLPLLASVYYSLNVFCEISVVVYVGCTESACVLPPAFYL